MSQSELLHQDQYRRQRADEWVHQQAQGLGVGRRRFLQLLAAGTGFAAIPSTRFASAEEAKPIVKPANEQFFVKSGSNLEMKWEAMYHRGYIVPNELFFVRNNSKSVPMIDPKTWELKIHGSGVAKPLALSYDELLSLPSVSVIRALECAGNGRNFFEVTHGKKIEGTPWSLGGIGVAEWTGVPLREVLDRAGVKQSAKDVMPVGLDEKQIKRPMPIEKALADDTLLVYAMNGDPLLPDHGAPVRMLLPGWVGIANVKWVGEIEVSEQALYSDYNTKKYVLTGPDYKPAPPANGPALTTQKVKSAFELAWDGELPVGKFLLRGRSWSGEGTIEKVDVSVDGGKTFHPARLREPNIDKAWVRWDIDWDVQPGENKLQARATDSAGNTQPMKIPLNEQGYAYWSVVTHTIRGV
ncbi:MAG: sulfite oxidase [Planctomycetota bacterium]|nr:sulfite oxidase [Planctomycetota bacterium]MDA1212751.1 sulfite oxidase [Planctomycetota bacterium]